METAESGEAQEPCDAQDPCGGPGASLAAVWPVELEGLAVSDRLETLAALTARFAATYLRWMGDRGLVLSYPRRRVLEVLESSGPLIMRDLADALGMTARNITAIVDALEKAGFVARRPHATDRRATLIELTDAGRIETDQARLQAADKLGSLFGQLSPAEQQVYADLLARLSANVPC